MIENLPAYINWLFVLTTFLTACFFFMATLKYPWITVILLAWLAVQAFIGLSGFYTYTQSMPPRFVLLVAPPFLTIVLLFITGSGRRIIDQFDGKWLTWLHLVRIPVELVLFWLFLYKQVPELMTFKGRNFDILSGITAPVIVYLGYNKGKIGKAGLLLWNFICLGLLINIVVNAVLSAPFPFQKFALDQPNVAVLYFPYVWLPGFIVPVVLLSHLVCIRQLLKKNTTR